MTNYGFHQAMREAGVEVATTDVGDRHVVDELAKRGWVLGGEQSGHIVDMRLTPSGDGIAAALMTLQALDGRELRGGAVMKKLPQVLRTSASPTATRWRARRASGMPPRARAPHSRARARAGPAVGHRAGCAGDGGSTLPGRVRGRRGTPIGGRCARAGRAIEHPENARLAPESGAPVKIRPHCGIRYRNNRPLTEIKQDRA